MPPLQRLGINVESLLVCQPDHGEMAFNVMDELVRSGAVSLIVVDSVSALVPKSEVEGDIGNPQVGETLLQKGGCRGLLLCSHLQLVGFVLLANSVVPCLPMAHTAARMS